MAVRSRSSRPFVGLLVLALVASWTFFGFGGGASAASGPATPVVSPAPVSNVLFINLQSGREDLHRVNMAFQMARNQRKTGRPVTMFFNINAPELATKNLPAALQYRSNPTIKAQVAELLGMGVTILVCPTCSADQGVTATDLVRGALVSSPTRLAEQLKPGTVSMSY